MSKQRIAGLYTGAGFILAMVAFVFELFTSNLVGFFFIMLLAIVCIVLAVRYQKIPKFFIFGGQNGESIYLNRQVINHLNPADVDHLSEAERNFFQHCKDNEAFRMHITLREGCKMSQEEICDMMLVSYVAAHKRLVESGLIDMAKVLTVEPGPND